MAWNAARIMGGRAAGPGQRGKVATKRKGPKAPKPAPKGDREAYELGKLVGRELGRQQPQRRSYPRAYYPRRYYPRGYRNYGGYRRY